MLKKMFLYDVGAIFRRVKRPIIAILISAIVSLAILLLSGLIPKTASFATALNNALTVVFYVLIITFAVLFVFCTFALLVHFYRSFFGSEGAFTLTLPVPTQKLLYAKLLASGLWAFVFLVLAAIAVTVGVLLPFEMLLRAENVSFLTNFTRTISESMTVLTVPALILSLFAKIAVAFFGITLGNHVFVRRSMLGALLFTLFFLALDITCHTLLNNVTEAAFAWEGGFISQLPALFSLLLSLLLGGAATIGTKKLLDRLNLYY